MRPLALWATPRTASTAFDKMMRTRGDHRVYTEPFSVPWYMGPDQLSARYEVSMPEATFEGVLEEITAASAVGPVFVKEMAYQLGPLLRVDVLRRFEGTFLIRDPAWALPSLARMWPDFTDEEAGYQAQHRAWSALRDVGEAPVVIDSDDLRREPYAVVEAWCDAVGIEYLPESLTWEPGMPAAWERWADWFTSAAESTGFVAPARVVDPPSEPEPYGRIDVCRAWYEELADNRLRA